jgi:hypothetical protein
MIYRRPERGLKPESVPLAHARRETSYSRWQKVRRGGWGILVIGFYLKMRFWYHHINVFLCGSLSPHFVTSKPIILKICENAMQYEVTLLP